MEKFPVSSQTQYTLLKLFQNFQIGNFSDFSHLHYDRKNQVLTWKCVHFIQELRAETNYTLCISPENFIKVLTHETMGNIPNTVNYFLDLFSIPRVNMTVKERIAYYYLNLGENK